MKNRFFPIFHSSRNKFFKGTYSRHTSFKNLKDKVENNEKHVADLEKRIKNSEIDMENIVGISSGLILGFIYLLFSKKGKNSH
jgi:hypothetical protein